MDDQTTVSDTARKATLLATTLFPHAQASSPSAAHPTSINVAGDAEPTSRHRNSTDGRLRPVTMEELETVVNAMLPHKAAGPDMLGPTVLKSAIKTSKSFRQRFLNLASAAVVDGSFPSQWKSATVAVIPKLGQRDLSLPKSYRPISLLSVAAKLIDHIVANRIQQSVQAASALTHQYGSMNDISGVHAAAMILHHAREAERQHRQVGIITIDVGSAFNNIDHDRLLAELGSQGLAAFKPFLAQWVQDRRFCIRFEGHVSESFNLGRRGIPQGSPLSPILWAVYAESLFTGQALQGVMVEGSYVDDIFATVVGDTASEVAARLQDWITRLSTWAAERLLLLDKPSFLITVSEDDPPAEGSLRLRLPDGDWIQPNPNGLSFLGITITSNLSLQTFVTTKSYKAKRKAELLQICCRESSYTPDTLVRVKMVQTILLPILDYAAALHPHLTATSGKEVDVAEKSIFLFGVGAYHWRRTPSSRSLAHELGLLTWQPRWLRRLTKFGLTALANDHIPGHSLLRSLAQEQLAAQPASFDASADIQARIANSFRHLERRQSNRWHTDMSPLLLIAKGLPLPDLEVITLPCFQVEGSLPYQVTIHEKEVALKTHNQLTMTKAGNFQLFAYTDGSLSNIRDRDVLGSGAFLSSTKPQPINWTWKQSLDASKWSIFEAELYAIQGALESISAEGTRWNRIEIFSDSQDALRRLTTPWKKDRSEGQCIRRRIHELCLTLHSSQRTKVRFWWIPGHSECAGNTKADAEAKAAARSSLAPRGRGPIADYVAWSKVTAITENRIKNFAATLFESKGSDSLRMVSPTWSKQNRLTYAGLDPLLRSLLLRFRVNVIIIGTKRSEDERSCPCSHPLMDRTHLLLHCPLLDRPRHLTRRYLPPPTDSDSDNIRVLLQGGQFKNPRGTDGVSRSDTTTQPRETDDSVNRRQRYFDSLFYLLREANEVIKSTTEQYFGPNQLRFALHNFLTYEDDSEDEEADTNRAALVPAGAQDPLGPTLRTVVWEYSDDSGEHGDSTAGSPNIQPVGDRPPLRPRPHSRPGDNFNAATSSYTYGTEAPARNTFTARPTRIGRNTSLTPSPPRADNCEILDLSMVTLTYSDESNDVIEALEASDQQAIRDSRAENQANTDASDVEEWGLEEEVQTSEQEWNDRIRRLTLMTFTYDSEDDDEDSGQL